MRSSLTMFGNTLTTLLFDGGYVSLDFIRPFLAMPKLKPASLWSFGLTKTFTKTGSGANAIYTPTYHFYMKDHLGSNRVVASAAGVAEQVNHYYPYGSTFYGETTTDHRFKYCGRSALRYAFDTTWRKKELDRMHGLDWYNSSARYYDHVLGRFQQIDPLAEKYYAWSPYAYCMGNPVNKIDLYGDSAVVLIDHSGAFFLGHMAMLIQKESGQWDYYSKNGRDKKPDLGDQKFSSPAVFLKSHNYDEGFVIPMTTDEDNKAREGMLDALNEQYSTFLSNCGQSVQAALRNAGKKDGSKVMKDTQNTHSGIVDSPQLNDALNIIPNVLFMNIKLQNEGYEIYK